MRGSPFFHAHAHTKFSTLDGMPNVDKMVAKATLMGQPALALSDHGNMANVTQLYKGCKAAGIKPFPGCELYVLDPKNTDPLGEGTDKVKRFHLGMLALNTDGYKAMVKLVTMSHTRPRFSRFPRLTVDDLAEFSDEHSADVAMLSGCFFGYAQQGIVAGDSDRTYRWLDTLSSMFEHTYVELQNHGIVHEDDVVTDAIILHDDDIVDELLDIADGLGLPVIATQDSHYLDQHEKEAHALMKRMVYGGVEDEFPGDSFHLASEEWVAEHYDPDLWDSMQGSYEELLSLNDVVIPALDTYRPRVPSQARNPDAVLARLVEDFLVDYPRAQGRNTKKYDDRAAYELGVIRKLKQADYLMLWVQAMKWIRDEGICVEARGSGNGSLVNFALGLTQVDPIQWNLGTASFDRFLSLDRIKPPDVDMDIEDIAKPRLVAYLRRHFNVSQIGTWAQLGARDTDEGGSVVAAYRTYLTREVEKELADWKRNILDAVEEETGKRPRSLPDEYRAEYTKRITRSKIDKTAVYEAVRSMPDIQRYFADDYPGLKKIAKMGNVYKSAGVHAGGVLLAGDDLKLDDWIPMMLIASSDTTASQFDMDDLEQWGLLKMDWLGQKSLTILRRCQELIGREDPTDFTWIPYDDAAACKILREGRPDNGVFHYEGKTKAYGGRELGIKSTRDAILGQALFMPGAMDTGQKDAYIQRRKNPELRENIVYPHPAYEAALGRTYGAVVYQEQVLQIMRSLGMDIGTINMLFKIVKDSGVGAVERNRARIKPIRAEFDKALRAYDKTVDTQHAWDWITGVVAYAFNEAHATGYGIRAYRFAYLKAHYPIPFMAALLECNAKKKKEPLYMREARHMGITLAPAHVNKSGVQWKLDPNGRTIRRGLMTIKGIGVAAAEQLVMHAPYESVLDLATRVTDRGVTGRKLFLENRQYTGTIGVLMANRALEGLPTI